MKYEMFSVLLFLIVFSSAAHSSNPVNILVLEFTIHKNDSVSLSDYYVDSGLPTVFGKANTGYRIIVYSKGGSAIYEAFFRPALEAVASGGSTVSTGSQNEAYVRLRLPYMVQMSYLEIYHGGKMIHAQDLSTLCDNNRVCDGHENALSCPSDCSRGEGKEYCSTKADDICNDTCAPGWDPDCTASGAPPQKNAYYYLLDAAAFIVVLALIAFLARKVRNR